VSAAIVERLLAGSGVSASSHPVLCSLLELAAKGPGVFDRRRGSALSRRLSRHWVRVSEAFRACVALGVSDADLRAFVPLGGLSVPSGGVWEVSGSVGLDYRLRVALILEKAVALKSENGLVKCTIRTVADLRAAQKLNRIAPFGRLPSSNGRIESGLVGGRFVVSWVIGGARVYFVLCCDEFGNVRCVGHRDSKKSALELLNLEPAKP
jgi:hypothetical protein